MARPSRRPTPRGLAAAADEGAAAEGELPAEVLLLPPKKAAEGRMRSSRLAFGFGLALLLLAACGPSGGNAKDEGKPCTQRSDCIEVCADVCSAIDAGVPFHCTSFANAINACLCGVTVDGGVRTLGC